MKKGLARLDNSTFTLSNIFDDFLGLIPATFIGNELFPKVDVHDDEKAVFVKAELPGIEEKDVEVTLKDNMLTIAGEKKEEKTEGGENKNYWYCERSFGSFNRSIELPEGIKADAVKASFKNGVLEIELPKGEAAIPKKININVN